jgi:subtilisin family serine protease
VFAVGRKLRSLSAIARGCIIVAAAPLLMAAGGGPIVPAGVSNAEWALHAADLERAWQLSTGAGVTVAVVDSGVDGSHPDLQGKVERGADYGDGSSGDGTHDSAPPRGHGTEVASLIAATGANYAGNGLLGVAPDAMILPFGVYRDGKPDAGAAAEAVRAASARGVKVIVVTPVGHGPDPRLASAVQQAIQRDVIVVSGVGSDPGASGPEYPAAIPGVVAVTAIDRSGHLLGQAQRGPAVVLAAPGVGMLAASNDNAYWTGDDTAYAAAWVGGAAALLRSAHPSWSESQVVQKLVDTARPEGGTPRNADFGFGVLNVLRTLADPAVPDAMRNPLVPAAAEPNVVHAAHRTSKGRQRVLGLLPAAAPLTALFLVGVASVAVFLRRRRVGDPDLNTADGYPGRAPPRETPGRAR